MSNSTLTASTQLSRIDRLEALVREYGNTPLLGHGRTRTDVMADILASQHTNSGAPVAILAWQERMPEPRRAYTCDMNCSSDRRHNSPTSCGDCMPVVVRGDSIAARDSEIAELRAALANEPAPAVPATSRKMAWTDSPYKTDYYQAQAWAAGWNECRAAQIVSGQAQGM